VQAVDFIVGSASSLLFGKSEYSRQLKMGTLTGWKPIPRVAWGLIISLGNAVTGSIIAEVVRLRFLPFRPEVSRLRLLLAFRKVMISAVACRQNQQPECLPGRGCSLLVPSAYFEH
jgi:hypothetical protein